jgi:hypothetical protein
VTRPTRQDLWVEGHPGKASGQYQPVWLVPALSGRDMVAALESASFRRSLDRESRVELTRDDGVVVSVPMVSVLDSDQLREVLAAARLSVTRLLEILERLPE